MPDFIKIDVEGAEAKAAGTMLTTGICAAYGKGLDKLRGAAGVTDAGRPAAALEDAADAARLVAVALSQGGAVALLAAGATEDEMGLTTLREVAAGRLPRPRTWWWTYRIRLAVR